MDRIQVDWTQAASGSECTWHQLSPYIGKMKSSMAKSLIAQFTQRGDTLYDPFSGAGTVALEAWFAGRNVFAGDLSPYAYVLSKGKLNPPRTTLDAVNRLDRAWSAARREVNIIDLRRVPTWVRRFFHPETLRETLAIRNILMRRRQYFLLSCLLGILHHWRPGFLSYPSSHTVPYLKDKLYPSWLHADLYEYRDVYSRLLAKLRRAFKRVPSVDRKLIRMVQRADATTAAQSSKLGKVSAIITSPPYMNSLSYARDNRLRLWFLGVNNHRNLEPRISPRKTEFLAIMRTLLPAWARLLRKNGPCVLVLGSVRQDGRYHDLPADIINLATNIPCGLRVSGVCRNIIPDDRRARVNCRSVREDTILVLRKGN
ncbi:MAG: DNA adenine methylase [Planctomycetota bacterium]|jgi:hypothetical protein